MLQKSSQPLLFTAWTIKYKHLKSVHTLGRSSEPVLSQWCNIAKQMFSKGIKSFERCNNNAIYVCVCASTMALTATSTRFYTRRFSEVVLPRQQEIFHVLDRKQISGRHQTLVLRNITGLFVTIKRLRRLFSNFSFDSQYKRSTNKKMWLWNADAFSENCCSFFFDVEDETFER